MKTNLLKTPAETPKDLTLDQIMARFNTDESARAYWESIHWPNGAVCPHCKNADAKSICKIQTNTEKKVRAGLHQCGKCGKQFTSTIGTIFEDSHIPLRKWIVAFYLNSSSKKGISSLQLQRILDLGSYRTALFMQHRIRHALRDPIFTGKLSGTVEADETYVGGKTRGRGRHFMGNKVPVFALVERGGRVRSQVMKHVTGKNLKAVLKANVVPSATIMTDELPAYRRATKDFASHQAVNHSAREYVRGLAHTQSVDGFFSLLKRGVVGTFHHISEQHLPLYLSEFDHRHNTRFLTDGERTVIGLKKANGKRLTYKEPLSR
jgi:transposase-like protein/Zn ribbon nucleic-acid-binding protein